MGTELSRTDQRQLSTPSGALALRRIARLASIADCDAEQARSLLPADAAELVEQARDEANAWLAPARKPDARMHLVPTLALVAPSGMGEAEQATWLAAAMGTLSGIPADLLERGCKAARLKVDHPAKIVPAINAEISAEWDRRRAELSAVGKVAALLAAPGVGASDYVTPEQAAAIRAEFGLETADRAHRPPPATAADYMAMGLSEIEAHKAVSDHAKMLAGAARPVGATEPAKKAARFKAPPEIGYGLIATALAGRYVARREGDARGLAGYGQSLAKLRSTYGTPPIAALLPLTREKLRNMRINAAA
jgi:hypothetical protein